MDLFTRSLKAGPDEVLIGLRASTGRRLIGIGALLLLCMIPLWHGYDNDIGTDKRLALIVLGLAGLFGAMRIWQSSRVELELTPSELRESGGRQIVRVADIVKIDREAFEILKPTNGFVIVTRESMPLVVSPGIWWRFGKRIGVGGFTGAGEGKAMAELLQEMLKRRDAE